MPRSEVERLATIEQVLVELRGDVDELRLIRRDDHHRLRDLENSVTLLVDAHRDARAAEARQYRRLEMRLQWLTLAVAASVPAITAIVAVVVHH